jgi:hypothetical protein
VGGPRLKHNCNEDKTSCPCAYGSSMKTCGEVEVCHAFFVSATNGKEYLMHWRSLRFLYDGYCVRDV